MVSKLFKILEQWEISSKNDEKIIRKAFKKMSGKYLTNHRATTRRKAVEKVSPMELHKNNPDYRKN